MRLAPKAIISVLIAAAAGIIAVGCNKNTGARHTVADFPEKEIRDLSDAIKNAEEYRRIVRHSLDLLEDTLYMAVTPEEKCEANIRLADSFRLVNTDSAIYYASRAVDIAGQLDERYKVRADIAVVNALSTAGLVIGATDIFHSINSASLPQDMKIKYWGAGRRLYSYLKTYSQGTPLRFEVYESRYDEYADSLITHLPEDDPMKQYLYCERLAESGRYDDARRGLEQLLPQLSQETTIYSMVTFLIAKVWSHLGDEDRGASYLALSALNDVKGCISEGLALPYLAHWLYEHGDLENAFSFINFALEEAHSGNTRLRSVTIGQFVPIIDAAYQQELNKSRNELLVYVILVTVLLIVTVTLILFLMRQIKLTKSNAESLAKTSRRQESYIANFIGLYSVYADRFNHLLRLVSSKLAAGQSAELKKLIDSGKYADDSNDNIHKIFDHAFLDIYPDFINNINGLLRQEERIEPTPSGGLTPELRIYAFVKLGIDESSRIARILHYSTNTVYTYRNKMRNKAINRDTFDEDVKGL